MLLKSRPRTPWFVRRGCKRYHPLRNMRRPRKILQALPTTSTPNQLPLLCMQRPLRPPRLHLRRAMEVSPARTELSARPTSLAVGTTACPTPDAVPATPVPTAGISSARMAPAPDSSGAQSPAPAIPDAPVAASPTDATPTSSVAARRLEKFAEAVQVKRPSPIIAEPPRQKPVLHSCAANGPQSGLQTR